MLCSQSKLGIAVMKNRGCAAGAEVPFSYVLDGFKSGVVFEKKIQWLGASVVEDSEGAGSNKCWAGRGFA